MSSSGKPDWYALYVRSNFEKIAERALADRGYPSFSPFYRARRKWSDRTKDVDLPLFPGYVFCSFDPEARLPILTTPGVVHVVSVGPTPAPVDLTEIESVQATARSGYQVLPWPFLREGQRVRIEAGPLSGVEGTLVKTKSDLRLVVSVTLLQRAISVEIDQDLVKAIF